MKPVKTLAELSLLKNNLEQKVRYQEEKMNRQSGQIISTVKLFISGIVIETGVISLAKHLLKNMSKKKADN